MYQMVVLFYVFLLIGMLFGSFFIVFHLANYSVNRRVARRTILIFLLGSTILLLANIATFFSLPPDDFNAFILPSEKNPSTSSGF